MRDFRIRGLWVGGVAPIMTAIAVGSVLMIAAPARAETHFYSYNAADRLTQAMTQGVTLEVRRGLLGATSVRTLYATTQRGSAELERGGPREARQALPEGADVDSLYAVSLEGDGRGLARALCPGSERVWLGVSRVRAAHPVSIHAVGHWPDGRYRACVALSYDYRGEWAAPPRGAAAAEPAAGPIQP